MYNANVKTIPHREQRYDTLGDYFTEGGVIQFRVSSMGNADYEFLIWVHEAVEKQLARKLGITEQMIDAFDLANEDVEEPGELEDCPYRECHLIAEGIERVVAQKLGVDWDTYGRACSAVLAKHLPPADPTLRDQEAMNPNPQLLVPKNERKRPYNKNTVPKGKIRERSILKTKGR